MNQHRDLVRANVQDTHTHKHKCAHVSTCKSQIHMTILVFTYTHPHQCTCINERVNAHTHKRAQIHTHTHGSTCTHHRMNIRIHSHTHAITHEHKHAYVHQRVGIPKNMCPLLYRYQCPLQFESVTRHESMSQEVVAGAGDRAPPVSNQGSSFTSTLCAPIHCNWCPSVWRVGTGSKTTDQPTYKRAPRCSVLHTNALSETN